MLKLPKKGNRKLGEAEGMARDEARKGAGAKSYLGSQVRISVSVLRAVGGL